MKCRSILTLFFMVLTALCLASPSFAQTPIAAGSRIQWDIDGPSLAEVQAYTYKAYRDTATVGTVLTGVTCSTLTAPTIFTCITGFPADTPGVQHTIAISASNVAGESLKSTPLAYQFFVVPADPRNLRVR